MLQKSNWSEATYLLPNQDLGPSAAFYGHAVRRSADVSGVTSQAGFSILIPTLSGEIVPLWLPHSPCDMNNHSLRGPGDPPAGPASA